MNFANRLFIVGTDLSISAEYVLLRAIALAKECNAELRVLHVVPADVHARRRAEALRAGLGDVGSQMSEMLAMLQEDLNKALGQFAGYSPLISTEVRVGDPLGTILEEAHDTDAGLIIVGAHRQDFFADHLLSATSERILRKGDRPVLAVKGHSANPYRRVLVGTDFSRHSEYALAVATALASTAQFHLVHIPTSPDPEAIGAKVSGDARAQADHAAPDAGFEMHMAEMARRIGLPPRRFTCHVLESNPGQAIERKAKELDADLIAIGSRGLNPVMQLLLGTVSRHVLLMGDSDVLIARSPDTGY